jgi:transcription elongation factor B subunit 1
MVGNGDAPAPREPEGEEEDTGGVVKLISAEGFEFVVDKKAAMVSNTLRATCSHPRVQLHALPFDPIPPPSH